MLWHDRIRDLILQALCVGILFGALDDVWSPLGPFVWSAAGVVIALGNFRIWVGGDVGRR